MSRVSDSTSPGNANLVMLSLTYQVQILLKNYLPCIMLEQTPLVLLIDDDDDDLELLETIFKEQFIRTQAFVSSSSALNYLAKPPSNADLPTLIILDYNMPGINGQQLLSYIKSNKRFEDVRVIMYSTGMNAILKQGLLEMGAYDCFTKPVSFSILKKQVNVFKQLAYAIENAKVYEKRQVNIIHEALKQIKEIQ